jgi:hypothetical protein
VEARFDHTASQKEAFKRNQPVLYTPQDRYTVAEHQLLYINYLCVTLDMSDWEQSSISQPLDLYGASSEWLAHPALSCLGKCLHSKFDLLDSDCTKTLFGGSIKIQKVLGVCGNSRILNSSSFTCGPLLVSNCTDNRDTGHQEGGHMALNHCSDGSSFAARVY